MNKLAAYRIPIILLTLLLAGAFTWMYVSSQGSVEEVYQSESDVVATTTVGLPREFPTRIRIPELSLEAEFESPLELNDDGSIEVPDSFEKVGWYKLGAAPGEVGTASILGHVDSYQGPAVFYSLGKLEVGDRIYIDRADGTEAVFEVERMERYKQDNFPTEEVYAPTAYPSLRLITCSGTYVKSAQRYTHNLVIFGKYLSPEEVTRE